MLAVARLTVSPQWSALVVRLEAIALQVAQWVAVVARLALVVMRPISEVASASRIHWKAPKEAILARAWPEIPGLKLKSGAPTTVVVAVAHRRLHSER